MCFLLSQSIDGSLVIGLYVYGCVSLWTYKLFVPYFLVLPAVGDEHFPSFIYIVAMQTIHFFFNVL